MTKHYKGSPVDEHTFARSNLGYQSKDFAILCAQAVKNLITDDTLLGQLNRQMEEKLPGIFSDEFDYTPENEDLDKEITTLLNFAITGDEKYLGEEDYGFSFSKYTTTDCRLAALEIVLGLQEMIAEYGNDQR